MKSLFTLPNRSSSLLAALAPGVCLLLSSLSPLCASPTFEIVGKFPNATTNPQPGVVLTGSDVKTALIGTTRTGGNGKGTVFKMSATGALSTLLTFSGSNGQYPLSGLVLHPNGNLYGTMTGTGGNGTLFSITQTGTLTQLVTLSGVDDPNLGAQPGGTMTVASNGNLYGVTSAGGYSDLGTLFELTTSGSFSSLYSFSGGDGWDPQYPPIQTNDGYLWGTTFGGGSEDLGTIYRYDPLSGELVTGYEFASYQYDPVSGEPVTIPPYSPNSGLIQGKDGFLYGTCCTADLTQGAIYKIDPVDGTVTNVFEFTTNLGLVAVGGVIQDNDGNFYGATSQGGTSGFGVVYKVTPAGKATILHTFSGGSADGGVPTAPLSFGADGNMYGVSNSTLFRIRFGPKPVSYAASPISYNSATLYASVNPNGDTTTVYFECWNDSNLASGTTVKASPTLSGTVARTASFNLKKLSSTTTYYYRLNALNRSGTAYGLWKSFTTKAFAEPTSASGVIADKATLLTTINPAGESVKVYFRYGVDPYLSADDDPTVVSGNETLLTSGMAIGNGYDDIALQKTISNLLPQTIYYYRAETVALSGTQFGNTHWFTTKVMGQFNGFVTNPATTGINSGFISVNLNSSQSMTGVLYYGGTRYNLKGSFSSAGAFSQTITRGSLPSLVVRLSVDPANHQLKGSVVVGGITSTLTAGQQLYNSKTEEAKAPQAGNYTILLHPDDLIVSSTTYPQGTGYLTMSVKTDGKVSVSGKLGDGSSISSSGVIISGSIFPLYAGLYGSNSSTYRGSIFGNIVFYPDDTPACDGKLTWFKAAHPGTAVYPMGFPTTVGVEGSLLLNYPGGTNAFTGSTDPQDASVTCTGTDLEDFSATVTLQPNNHVSTTPSDRISMSLSRNGKISGSFFDVTNGKTRKFFGVFLQSQGYGGGYFMESTQSGNFQIGL